MADKLHGGIKAGVIDVSIPVELRKTADSTEQTGKVAADVTASYWRQGGTRTAITVSNLTNLTDAHSDGGWKEVDATNCPGLYRFDLPDAAVATGVEWVVVTIKVASTFLWERKYALETKGGKEVWDDTQAIKAKTDNLPSAVQKNVALNNFMFKLVLSADHVSPATGKTVTGQRSLDGAAFGALANSVTEISDGWYKVNLAAADLNGDTVALKFTATATDQRDILIVTEPGASPGGQTLVPDGTQSAPGLAFANDPNTGLLRRFADILEFVAGGLSRMIISAGGFVFQSIGSIQWSSTSDPADATDLALVRDAAYTLAQRLGTNAQLYRIYNTFTDTSNYERGFLRWVSNILEVGTEKAGTGSARALRFLTDAVARWEVGTAGHLTAVTDNSIDIGASGATRPRSLYVGSRGVFGRTVLTYGTTIATDVALSNAFSITVTDGVAFTISNPTNPVTGQRITYTIRNTSGGAMGAITWGAAFKLAAFTNPANANSRSIEFIYDGTNWIELNRATADVPN